MIIKRLIFFLTIISFSLFFTHKSFANKIEEKEIDILEAIKKDIDEKNQQESFELNNIKNPDSVIDQKNSLNPLSNIKTAKSVYLYDFSSIIEDILPSVVNITSQIKKEDNKNSIDNAKSSSIGSGYIASNDGLIVTSYHVVKDFNQIEVTLNNEKKYQGKLIAFDEKTDLALVKIDAQNLKTAKLGDSNQVKIGNWVLVVGNPYGLGQSVSTGIISAKGRNLKNGQSQEFIQTDAAINNGNSGGPMFNLDGEIIGLNSTILSPTGGSVGLGFAIPSQTLKNIIDQLKNNGRVIRGWVGVTVRDISPEIAEAMNLKNTNGAFINDVTKNGPADLAGIIPSDIVIKIDDKEIMQMKTLPKIVTSYQVGKKALFEVIRQGKIKKIEVEIAEMPSAINDKTISKTNNDKIESKNTYQFLGITVANLTSEHKDQLNIARSINGVLVTNIDSKSQAILKGIEVGDIIMMANQNSFENIKELKKIITKEKESTDKLMLFIKRSDTNYPIVLDFDKNE